MTLIRSRGEGSFLDHVTYREPEASTATYNLIQDMVVEDMLRYPEWYEKLGLNFKETMDLEYSQYFQLRKKLIAFEERVKRETPKALDTVEQQLKGPSVEAGRVTKR